MSDILEEVIIDHIEARKIRYFKFTLYCAAGLTVFIALCMGWWNRHTTQKIKHGQEVSEMLIKALEANTNDNTLSLEALDHIINTNTSEITDLALLGKARILLSDSAKSGDRLRVLENTEKLAKNKLTKAHCGIMWMSALLDSPASAMTAEEASTLQAYSEMFKSDTSPFYGTGAILRAALAIKYGHDLKTSRQIIEELLSSGKAMPLVQDQAQALLANINLSEGIAK
ncbi:MAG: hypothetical protein V4485_03785 [Pseudomonadota bacterium]